MFVVFLCVGFSYGQAVKKWTVRYHISVEDQLIWTNLKPVRLVADSAAGLKDFKAIILKAHAKGYLTASVDEIIWKEDTVHVTVYLGKKYKWARLTAGNVNESILREVGFRERFYNGLTFRYGQVVSLEERLLNFAQERGYPFAVIGLDSVAINDQAVMASLNYQPGVRIVLDTLRIIGSARLRQRFLERWLRLQPGMPYSQNRLDQADALLRQQPYLAVNQPYEVVFKNDRAYLTFYANAGKASEADGIIGFQPNEQEKGRLLLTGELNLKLRNLFNAGGNFAFNWQQIKRASPRLNISYAQPAFLGTPLEVNASFQLLREDSATSVQNGFLTLSQQANVFYNLTGFSKIGVGIERRTSRLADSTLRLGSEGLPLQANTNWLAYRIQYIYNHVDNFFYPRRGWWASATLAIGNKQIPDSESLSQPGVSIKSSSPQLAYQLTVRKYIPLRQRSAFFGQLTVAQIFNDNLFQNDLFRLGGLTSLRGFNENFFFASAYGVATLEYRFFWEPTSYLFAFYDHSLLQTRILNQVTTDNPSGIGAGLSFSTKAGIFTIVYALGNSRDRSLGLGFSKIHFGLVSRF